MKPTKETIRALTPPQRTAIRKIQSQGEYRRYDTAGIMVMRELAAKKIIQLKPGENNVYILIPAWENVDVDIKERVHRSGPPQENPPIPDPPRKMIRPPAIYSNRTREEMIDNILKNR